MLTEGVTNMPTWVVITAICKFCDTSPLSLWKRRSRLHHTFWKLYVILLSSLSLTIGSGIKFSTYPSIHIRLLIKKTDFMAVVETSFGSWYEWKIGTQSVKRHPNSNLISGEVFTRGRRLNDNEALKWLIFVGASSVQYFPECVYVQTINLSLCTIVERSRYFFCLTIPLRNCHR